MKRFLQVKKTDVETTSFLPLHDQSLSSDDYGETDFEELDDCFYSQQQTTTVPEKLKSLNANKNMELISIEIILIIRTESIITFSFGYIIKIPRLVNYFFRLTLNHSKPVFRL